MISASPESMMSSSSSSWSCGACGRLPETSTDTWLLKCFTEAVGPLKMRWIFQPSLSFPAGSESREVIQQGRTDSLPGGTIEIFAGLPGI
jgi:hypothetical protein